MFRRWDRLPDGGGCRYGRRRCAGPDPCQRHDREGTDYAGLKIVDELNAEEYGVAFRKGSDAAAAVDAAFDELKADGTMQALAEKYELALAD